MESPGRTDILKRILVMLERRKLPAGAIMHELNLTEKLSDDCLGTLIKNGAVELDGGGFCRITPKGRAALASWEKVDASIRESRPPLQAATRTGANDEP